MALNEIANIFKGAIVLETRFLKALRKHFDESIERKKDDPRIVVASRA